MLSFGLNHGEGYAGLESEARSHSLAGSFLESTRGLLRPSAEGHTVEFGFEFDPSQLVSAAKLAWVSRYAA